MRPSEVDKLTMLLSSDWFLPYWHLIGVAANTAQKGEVQQGSREIVRQFMSGAKQYWDIDFSVVRARKTRSMMENLLSKCKLEYAISDRINRLASADEMPIDDGTRWLIVSMTEQLLDNSLDASPPLDDRIKSMLDQDWKQRDEVDLKEQSLASASDWDKYLRSTTPDLPSMLADYAASMISHDKFEVLWALISTRLTPNQRHELFDWYRSVGRSLTGEPIRLAHEA